jgi:quercetin dioxygenase-like cupin family protein
MKPRFESDVPATVVEQARGTTMRMLVGTTDGAPNFVLRKFTMKPGGGMPLHTNDIEHVQYVLAGRARVTIGDDAFDVRRGMSLLIPAGTPHAYETVGEEPFEFLCAVPISPR